MARMDEAQSSRWPLHSHGPLIHKRSQRQPVPVGAEVLHGLLMPLSAHGRAPHSDAPQHTVDLCLRNKKDMKDLHNNCLLSTWSLVSNIWAGGLVLRGLTLHIGSHVRREKSLRLQRSDKAAEILAPACV